jgi:hypothetical protein
VRQPSHRPVTDPGSAERARGAARKMVGKPYRFGGSSPAGFDCSGLVQYSYKQAGVPCRAATDELLRLSQPLRGAHLRRGDLLFFDQEGRKKSHVRIYLGDGQFVHAPSSARRCVPTASTRPTGRSTSRSAAHLGGEDFARGAQAAAQGAGHGSRLIRCPSLHRQKNSVFAAASAAARARPARLPAHSCTRRTSTDRPASPAPACLSTLGRAQHGAHAGQRMLISAFPASRKGARPSGPPAHAVSSGACIGSGVQNVGNGACGE